MWKNKGLDAFFGQISDHNFTNIRSNDFKGLAKTHKKTPLPVKTTGFKLATLKSVSREPTHNLFAAIGARPNPLNGHAALLKLGQNPADLFR
jgi:hypothetical protein